MGVGRAVDAALERVAVIRLGLGLAVAATLSGCAAVGDITGAVAGLASGAATANPAVGIAVGVAVRAAANEGVRYVSRSRRGHEQDAIASVVAEMNEGETQPWALDRKVGGDTSGEVRVLRLIANPLAPCKEIAFSVAEGEKPPEWFTTVACEDGTGWKWALAEPAVDRWTNLQ